MNATMSASQPLAGAPSRGTSRALLAATLRRAMARRRRPHAPVVPMTLNAPQQFGNSFRYPDGTWYHGE
ncbi:hypothetical protein [Georgenia subflava]|uniref:Uncharacterized protein n=1 Tax=Georgenia subflava TaxID=1622177 RepID=A0A6N7EGD2_9MICO|nr:hypothetical protein [Georgenia subflava]MPV35737.1 hypothetical protein [Georgenia subflava]